MRYESGSFICCLPVSCRWTGEASGPCRGSGPPSSRHGWCVRCRSTSCTSIFCAACSSCRAATLKAPFSTASSAWSGKKSHLSHVSASLRFPGFSNSVQSLVYHMRQEKGKSLLWVYKPLSNTAAGLRNQNLWVKLERLNRKSWKNFLSRLKYSIQKVQAIFFRLDFLIEVWYYKHPCCFKMFFCAVFCKCELWMIDWTKQASQRHPGLWELVLYK